MLKLMYITNRPEVAKIAENAGVDRIFVDMEYIGKDKRQGGMDTVQSHHTIEDVKSIRKTIKKAELLVRCNPIHNATEDYCSSKEEIDSIVDVGADIIMLPYFKTVEEVEMFSKIVNGRVKTMLLVETVEAVDEIDKILAVPGIDEVFIGLNDLSLGYGRKFMFELLADGTVESLCIKFKQKNIPYGFGGIAALGKGDLPSEYIIKEHYRLDSTSVILSRSFCNTDKINDIEEIYSIFMKGLSEIREFEKECEAIKKYFDENKKLVTEKIKLICQRK